MTATIESLGIDRLSVDERLELIHAIWDTVCADTDRVALTDEQKQEIDRRLAAHRADPAAAVPFEEVEAAARARIGR